MKMFRKLISAVLVCAMALTLLTACGSSGSSSNSDSQDLVAAINAQLKAKGSSITVTADDTLTTDAKKAVEVTRSHETDDNYSYAQFEAALQEIAGSNKFIMFSEKNTIPATAAEFAEQIIAYAAEGKTTKSIGYASDTIIYTEGPASSSYFFTVAVVSYE